MSCKVAAVNRGPSLGVAVAISVLLIMLMALLRLQMMPDQVVPLSYALALLVCIWLRRLELLWAMAASFLVMSAAKAFLLLPQGSPETLIFAMQAANVLVTAGIVHAVMLLRRRLESEKVALEEANNELETSNEELRVREEEIAQQNEELQSQAEELEQQTEELTTQTEDLQALNEELNRREALLHALLEAPRALRSEETALHEICRWALPLLGAPAAAAAIVEVGPGRGPRVRGQFGFPDLHYPRADFRFEDSFAAIIMEEERTAYIEDVQRRPDLHFLNAGGDKSYRSILSTPLRRGGTIVGFLAAYSVAPAQWTTEQFRLIEWLSGECGRVLEILDLQRELNQRRVDAEEASIRKSRFLAAVSHDIRTPVNAITLTAEWITRLSGDPERSGEIREFVQELKSNSRALAELVTDVLDITRFDAGMQELQISDFGVCDLLTAEARRLRPAAEAKGLSLELHLPACPVYLRTDRLKLARILGNLLGNAIKFTECGGAELRAALRPTGELLLEVSDTGPGIAADHVAHIFDEFFQLHNPARDRLRGSGLGLSICKRLADALGCRLEVESEVGRGSKLRVLVPASAIVAGAEEAAEAVESAFAAPGDNGAPSGQVLRGLRVLLVEDHDTTRRATGEILAGRGATVLAAENGRLGLHLLEHGSPHVLLLDLMLPDLDGTEILRQIRRQRPPSLRYVLVVTGDASERRRIEVRQLGADGLVLKPVEVESLVQRLAPLVDHQGPRRTPAAADCKAR